MISVEEARQRAKENLEGFPQPLVDAYLAFAETGDLAKLDEVVLGVLAFYLAKPPTAPLATLPGSTRLIEDLGCDSLTMADLLFIAETLFGVGLVDEEVAKIKTLDELREHLRRCVAPPTPQGA